MRKIKTILFLAALALISINQAKALTTVDFEGVPTTYYRWYENENLNGYYTGLKFEPDATILDKVIGDGYDYFDYPPHSGNAVLVSDSMPYIRVDFVDSTANYVEMWYTTTTTSTFYLEAYDSSDNLLASSTGQYNKGTNSFISVSADNIAYVKLHDSGNYFTIDDFGYETGAVIPAPGAILLSGIGIGIVGWLRRRGTL
jgi:hypothetical protein